MRLSDLQLDIFGVRLIRDGEFNSLGSFSREKQNMLVFIEEEKYIPFILEDKSKYSSVICRSEFLSMIPPHMGVCISDDPKLSFYKLHNYLAESCPSYHILPETDISQEATIHNTAFIDSHVKISKGCIVHPNATILRGTILEENVVIGPGSVIGGGGFRFIRNNTDIVPIVHVGGVLLKKGVEVHSNSCIDKAVYSDFTTIGEDTKISNLVHIAHNVVIGKRCCIPACTMIAGSTIIGDDVWIGPNATVSNGLVIGNSARISLGAVVTKNVPKNVPSGMTVSGNFAIEHSKLLRFIKSIR